MDLFVDIDWSTVVDHLTNLLLAYVVALPIAWDQEKRTRSAGLRTFPLVAVATCAYMLVGIEVFDSTDAEARVAQGLITGMGFIGGGAILKQDGLVTGTATARCTLGHRRYRHGDRFRGRVEIALVIMVLTFASFLVLTRLKGEIEHEPEDENGAKDA